MTTPDGYTPEGARTVGGVKDLQALNEAAIKRQLQIPAQDLFSQVRGGFATSMIAGIAGAIQGTLSGFFKPIRDAAKPILDGQFALNQRTELLSPMQDFGSVYMDARTGWDNAGVMPFNRQIGPTQGTRLESNGLRLLDVGMWLITAELTASWVRLVTSEFTWRVRVLGPDGSVFSEQRHTMSNANNASSTVVTSVVVKDPNCLVQVEILRIGNGREVLGGAQWNRLTVQHLTRRTDVGESGGAASTSSPENPDNDIVGTAT